MNIETAYQFLFLTALIILGILMGIVLIRSIIGPSVTDRILCINMIGTLVICSVAILSRLLHDRLKTVFLGHLSKENNLAELAYETVRLEVLMSDNEYKPDDFRIRVASRDMISEAVAV